MDRLKKQRKQERGAVTRLVTNIELEIAKDPLQKAEVETLLRVLEDHVTKLSDLDDKMKSLLLDDEYDDDGAEYEAECVAMEEYMTKATRVKVKADRKLLLHPPSSPTTSLDSPSSRTTGSAQKRNFRLPKIELKKFSGELTEWLGWWAQFQKIHEDEELHDSDKFTYLVQSMVEGSKAHEVAKRFPQSTKNYPKAMAALKERFGREKLLKQVYVRELIGMILNSRAKDRMSLATLYDRLESSLHSLESLGVSTEQMVEFLFPMVESSLPEETLMAWQRSPHFGEDGSTLKPPRSELDFLMDFLKVEINNEEQRKLARAGFGFSSSDSRKNPNRSKSSFQEDDGPTAAGLFSGSGQKPGCIFCDKGHDSDRCFKAQKMTMELRKKRIRSKRACFSCLKLGHTSRECKSERVCSKCGGRHVILTCPEGANNSEVPSQNATTVQGTLNCTNEVILRTLMVTVSNPLTNRKKIVRALLDCGSQKSYLLQKTTKDLGLVPRKTQRVNHQLFGGTEVMGQNHGVFDFVLGHDDGGFSFPVTMMDQAQICGILPRAQFGLDELRRKGIRVSDVDPRKPIEVEVLIGADYLGDILTGKLLQLDSGLTATETRFGWALMGRKKTSGNLAMSAITMTITSSTVQDLWKLETIGINDPFEVKSQEEKATEAQEHIVKTVTRNADGRYSVSLPWVGGSKLLPSNLAVAQQRLLTTTRKLNLIDKFSEYDAVFRDWEKEGIISTVPEVAEGQGSNCHYLPHRAVIKESKTTPVRPVFDASCKVGRNPSLNQCLEKGPNLLELIPSILLRFRMGRIGAVADVRKAFQMISVNEEDRAFLRFLWWEDSSQQKMKTFEHNRVVFGVNSSPFLLGAVITHHLNLFRSSHPEVVKRIMESLYVDNLVTTVTSPEEYQNVKELATDLMAQARMELRQWERTGEQGEAAVTNVLGLKWDKMKDTLFIDPIEPEEMPRITKRVILSQVQRVFDPLGFLAPVLIVPKILLQNAWLDNKKWDEDVSEEIRDQFLQWWQELLAVMDKIQVPRNCDGGRNKEDGKFQLHVFCDASQKAYAAAVFLRVETADGVKVQLLQAKSRVAPVKKSSGNCSDPEKKATIPRLELMSCAIAARLSSFVRKALEMEDVPTYYWSDSTTALSWIKRNDEWGTFVGNRVKEVLEFTRPEQWRHVPGILNPADLPSRGTTPAKFVELRWWEGPDWLKLEQEAWPKAKWAVDEAVVSQERKRISTLSAQITEVPWYIKSNSYTSTLRIMAYVFRFLNSIRKKTVEATLSLSPEEVNEAELRLFKLVQQESFLDGNLIEGLKVIRGVDGFIRVKTKLLFRQDKEGFKKPILLPMAHPLVDLFVMDAHLFNSHGGIQYLMGKIREKAWIIHGRRKIRQIIRSCVICQRFQGRKPEVPSIALPEDRVKDASAFQVTGVDLAGPLTLRNQDKVYICLFTCAVYRGVHLELLESMSTEDFLLAFVRFCKRKRRPETIYSDNGGNFKGANNLFKKINWDRVQERTHQMRINWKFNPPAAPWWGGWWERLVRSVKDLLRRMLGFRKVSYVELETCLVEVESVVNHRPLTFVTEDQEDLVPLTPAMFIYDLPDSDVPEEKLLTVECLQRRRKNLKVLLEELKARFRTEYLGQLVQRGRERKTHQFRVGDVVLVEHDKEKRIFWPMARILELIEGKDGIVRVARVKTQSGSYLRPLQRLIPLEVDVAEFDDHPQVRKAKAERNQTGQEREPTPMEGMEVKTRRGRVVHKPVKFCDY